MKSVDASVWILARLVEKRRRKKTAKVLGMSISSEHAKL
jgi:hypothetical protein